MSRLTAQNISLGYPKGRTFRPIIEDFSLTLEQGKITVLLGSSGCGKSTILNILAGFKAPDHGEITLDGQRLTAPSGQRAVVFQDDALMPWLNAIDNVALGLRIRGVSKAERRQQAQHYLRLVGLADYAQHAIHELSGGQRQRLGLARVLAIQPEFILLDEPFGALDALTREKMQRLLLQIWKETGVGILLITHSVDEGLLLASSLYVLKGPPLDIIGRFSPEFSRRFGQEEKVKSLKTDPLFAEQRQKILELLLEEDDDSPGR
ncbi:taurine ABC transporter ATP-binding protein [Tatumella terrea]|uniref:Taurine ABC transporter ATP-binding protein n=1 Tax=Tatumella terrea TaxID=419007 RepID=A0ABW1VZ65_9GAMM|nr:ATP-binding cassette domain-containing protein [Tatumella sp. JGM118]MBS0910824.1 ATP-binding cassette domain-containing protein [Tatumella sp. JGM118]